MNTVTSSLVITPQPTLYLIPQLLRNDSFVFAWVTLALMPDLAEVNRIVKYLVESATGEVSTAEPFAGGRLPNLASDDIVLDAFLGSGSTLIAAERTGRTCYGIELDSRYVDTAIRRWQRHTGSTAIHALTGRPFDETQPN